jgi:hypothetical protein
MVLARSTVSRKTPRDGRLEITKDVAARLAIRSDGLRVVLTGRTAPAHLDSMTCTCRGGDQPHEHHFVQSDLFKELPVGVDVDLSVNPDDNVITVRDVE